MISILFVLFLFSFCKSDDVDSKRQLLRTRQDYIKKQVDIIFPFLHSKDEQSKLVSCNFLNAFASQSPIDFTIPILENISKNDTMKTDLITKSAHIGIRYPVRDAASQAIMTNEGRKRLDSVILASSDSLSEIIYRYALPLQKPWPSYISFEIDHLTWKQKESTLSKLQAHNAWELEFLLEELVNCNYDLFESILKKHISDTNIDTRSILNIRNPNLSKFKNPILAETSKNILKSGKIKSGEWYSAISYLCGIHDYYAAIYLAPFLSDTTMELRPALQQQRLNHTYVQSKEYYIKSIAYTYIADFYGLPRFYTKEEIDIACTIFNLLWKAVLRDEAQNNLRSEPASIIK